MTSDQMWLIALAMLYGLTWLVVIPVGNLWLDNRNHKRLRAMEREWLNEYYALQDSVRQLKEVIGKPNASFGEIAREWRVMCIELEELQR